MVSISESGTRPRDGLGSRQSRVREDESVTGSSERSRRGIKSIDGEKGAVGRSRRRSSSRPSVREPVAERVNDVNDDSVNPPRGELARGCVTRDCDRGTRSQDRGGNGHARTRGTKLELRQHACERVPARVVSLRAPPLPSPSDLDAAPSRQCRPHRDNPPSNRLPSKYTMLFTPLFRSVMLLLCAYILLTWP